MNEKEYAELAWPKGDKPETHKENQLDSVSQKKLKSLFNLIKNDPVLSVSSIVPYTEPSLTGRFLVRTKKETLFMRVSKRTGNPLTEKEIIKHLFNNGCPVNPLLHSKILNYEPRQLRIDLRPYIESRFFNNSFKDIYKLGKGLGKIHRVLKSSPKIEEVKNNSIKRYEGLNSVKKKIAKDNKLLNYYPQWVKANKDFLEDFKAKFDPFYHIKENSGIIHGEVHPGNILFSLKNDGIVFIDFEESVHTFAPVSWDIGFAVQRFLLNDMPDYDIAEKRIEVFKDGYGEKEIPPFFYMMEQIVFFSIAVVFDLAEKGVFTSDSELLKFVKIYKNIQSYKGMFK